MQIGLLWYDNNAKKEFKEKVLVAASRYRDKFGQSPNTCYVHHEALGPAASVTLRSNGNGPRFHIRVVGAPNVLPHHFWIGIHEPPLP